MKKTKTKLLEELYFDSGNSGMSLRTVKKTKSYEGHDGKSRTTINYHMEYSHGAFGERTVVNIPLGNPKMARYIAEAILRTASTMEKEGSDIWKYSPFRTDERYVFAVKDGLRKRSVYRVEMVSGPNSTSSDLLGIEWLDDTGRYVYHEEYNDSSHGHGMCAVQECGEPDLFQPHEVGKSLKDVHAARLAADPEYHTYWTDPLEKKNKAVRYVDVGVDPWSEE